jgi:beta-glucoside operon transcriptional antiterminator
VKVKKIFNNNIILAENEQLLEIVLLGKGIAFQKKAGDEVDPSKIEKTFVLDSPKLTSRFITLLKDIPLNHVELSNKLIEQAQDELGVQFNDSIYIALTDHISYALNRYKNGISIRNALLWEIKKYYVKEYQAALHALEVIKYYERIDLPPDEAGFIALHFVNAQQDQKADIQQTILVTETVNQILNIVQYHYSMELDENSLNCSRFIAHIRFFVQSINNHEIQITDDDFLYNQIAKKFPKAEACAEKIKNYYHQKYHIDISKEEFAYLILYINRVTQRGKK